MSNGTLREREGGRKGGERERERERERENANFISNFDSYVGKIFYIFSREKPNIVIYQPNLKNCLSI